MENFPFGHVNLAIISGCFFFFFSAAINDRSTVGSGTLAAALFFFFSPQEMEFHNACASLCCNKRNRRRARNAKFKDSSRLQNAIPEEVLLGTLRKIFSSVQCNRRKADISFLGIYFNF